MAKVQATNPPQSCPTITALPGPKCLTTASQVADELVGLVVLDPFGLVAQVVAPLVDRHDMEVFRERRHLGAPGIPEIGEAVDHDQERVFLLAQADVMDLDPV